MFVPQVGAAGTVLTSDGTSAFWGTAGSGAGGQLPVTLASGANHDVYTAGTTSIVISGPTADFSIGGILAAVPGIVISVVNATQYTMSFLNNDVSSIAANRILTESGGTVFCPPGGHSTAELSYDGTVHAWRLTSVGVVQIPYVNAQDFFATYGGDTSGATDCSAAINAAIAESAAMITSSFGASAGGRVRLPAGNLKLTSSIHLQNSCILEGVQGGYDAPLTNLRPTAGVQAIVVDQAGTNGANTTSGQGSVIRDLGIWPSARNSYSKWVEGHTYGAGANVLPDYGSKWVSLHTYAEGDVVQPTVPNGRYYVCTTGGPAASTEPLTWGTVFTGMTPSTVVSGTAHFQCWGVADYGIYFTTVAGGTSATVPPYTGRPSWPFNPTGSLSGDTVVDNTVTWVMKELGCGIRLYARAKIENCLINSCEGDGFRIVADTNSAISSNANIGLINYCTVQNCGGNGWYFRGDDGNTWTTTLCSALSNTQCGFADDSFLGNTFVGTHTDGNLFGCYYGGQNTAASCFLGVYAESNQVAFNCGSSGIVIGGLLGSGFKYYSNSCIILGTPANHSSPIAFQGNQLGTGGLVTLNFGSLTAPSVLSWSIAGDPSILSMFFNGSATNGLWTCSALNSDSYEAYGITGYVNNEGVAMLKAKRGIMLGPDQASWESGPRITSASAAPTVADASAGAVNFWRMGDVIINTNPVGANGILEWVCTTTGGFPLANWSNGVFYHSGAVITTSGGNGFAYAARNQGTTGASDPTGSWTTTPGQAQASDNGIIWVCIGSSTPTFQAVLTQQLAVPARAVVTANTNLASFVGVTGGSSATSDGVTSVAGDVVLCTAQTTAAQNGPYVVGTIAAGAAPLTRPQWYPSNSTQSGGFSVYIGGEGTVFKNTTWKAMLAAKNYVVDTTDPRFYPQSVSGSTTLSNGTINVNVAPIFSSKTAVLLSRTTPTNAALTIQYQPSSITTGTIGTAIFTIQAEVGAGTISGADNSTLTWTLLNQA